MLDRSIYIVFSVSVLFVLFSCANNRLEKPAHASVVSNTSGDCSENLPDTISFQKQIIPILAQNCALASCHMGSRPEGNLNLEASVAFVQISRPYKGYLDTKDPKNSVLYNSLTSPANLMPPSGKMVDCKIDLIMKWMVQGAKNN